MKDTAIGYALDRNDVIREKKHLENTPERIAEFIWENKKYSCMVTDTDGRLICSSLEGGFLDRCPNQSYLRNELLPAVLDLQLEDEDNFEM